MCCIAGDPDPALHSQLGKTDGEVTNLVSCGTSVLHTRSSHGRSASWGPTFLATGTCNPGRWGYLRALPGGSQVDSGLGRYGNAGSRRHANVPKRGVRVVIDATEEGPAGIGGLLPFYIIPPGWGSAWLFLV